MKAHTCQQLVLVATLLAPLTTLSAQALPAGVRLQPDGGRTGILFGTAVSISGSSIATGAAFDANGMFGGAGSVFVHVRDGGGAWTLQQRLVPNDSAANDNLGAWVEIFGDSLSLPKFEMFEEGQQIRRSSKSVKSTIVEGYGRRRYKSILSSWFMPMLPMMKP